LRATLATDIESLPGWPAYRIPDTAEVYRALRDAASQVLGRAPRPKVAGPSGIGNYLSTIGIPTTSGFGVNYRNLHAADECVEIASVAPTYQAYLTALRLLME
jgi:succinyl-diaminopimelate desuccinylase